MCKKILCILSCLFLMTAATGCTPTFQADPATQPTTQPTTQSAVGDPDVSIALAGEDFPEDARTYTYYTVHETPYTSTVVLSARRTVYQLQVVSLTAEESETDGFCFHIQQPLYTQDVLTPEQPLVLTLEFPEILPNTAIVYVDEQGVQQVFALEQSGRDGSALLCAIDPVS